MEGRNRNKEEKPATEKRRKARINQGLDEKEGEEGERERRRGDEMVAIALYRGNLHRVPNTPRRWPPPPRTLSASQFKSLLRRRSLALSRLHPSPAPPPPPSLDQQEEKELVVEAVPVVKEEEKKREEEVEKEEKEEGELPNPDCAVPLQIQEHKPSELELSTKQEQVTTATAPEEGATDTEERRKELEKKLEDLNQKKHNLVQMLKLILNAEEDMKRRMISSTSARGSGSVPSESGPDTPSAGRPGPPRITVDVNFSTDLCGETDPGSTQSAPTRPFSQMQSPSPSGGNVSRSPFSHAARGPQASSSLLGNPRSSPARFVPPTGQLSHSSSLPPLLPLPGSNFVASSPSPAASGGATSNFKDSRFGSSS